MDSMEELEDEAFQNNVSIVNYSFESDRIKALYCDGTVALSDSLKDNTERKCILAEEIGHHYTAIGDITGNDDNSHKQELRGRVFAYDKLIGINGILRAYQHGCKSLHETAAYLEVTESFLSDALKKYRQKYGIYTTIDNYVIYFEPYLGVLELI